jgi:GNAT superfamily N-acetyltransferase
VTTEEIRPPRPGRPSTPPAVREATHADTPAMTQALARAFHDDPVFNWLYPGAEARLKHGRRYFEGRARLLLRQRHVYTVDGGHAAAMWARPGEWHDPPLEALRQIFELAPGIGRRALRALVGQHRMESNHPSEPHWYLAVLGTDPDHQGRGLASALMQPVLDGCDRDEIPAYLETATERNVAFYTRHGFRTTGEIQLPKGPRMWLMWRDPRP